MFLDYYDIAFKGLQTLNGMHLFPDSTIILGFDSGDQPIRAWIHKAATYMDPSFMLQQTIITNKLATYTLGSISVGYSIYYTTRHNI